MRTLHIARYVGVASFVLLAACGGGGFDPAKEVQQCRDALVRLGGVSPSSLDNPPANSSLYRDAAGTRVDFYNGSLPGTATYRSFGSCVFSGDAVASVTLADGAVIAAR